MCSLEAPFAMQRVVIVETTFSVVLRSQTNSKPCLAAPAIAFRDVCEPELYNRNCYNSIIPKRDACGWTYAHKSCDDKLRQSETHLSQRVQYFREQNLTAMFGSASYGI